MHHESRKAVTAVALLLGALTLGACEQELPTSVGGEHLPDASLRTYEILLDDAAFLSGDTLLRGFGSAVVAPLLLVAEDWRDTLDAHALIRFGNFPTTVTYADSGGTVTDTIEGFAQGRIVLRLDTLTLGLDTLGTDTTIAFEIYTVTEGFDTRTANWTAREALPGDTTFWTTPGGTVGTLIASATWSRNDTLPGDSVPSDSVVFTVDSAAVNALAGSDPETRAILVRTTTPGARVAVAVPRLGLTAHMVGDTATRQTSAVIVAQTFIYDPPPPAPGDELRLGDRTAWRSFLRFRPGLDTVTVECPDDPGCSFRLGDVTVNRAELWLTALEVSEVWRIRGNMVMEARPVLGDDTRPLERAPLGDTTGVAFGVQPGDFAVAGDSTVRLGATRFVRGLLEAGTDTAVTERNRTLALVSGPEPLPYGIVRFGGFGSEYAPTLRLIVTVPVREEDR